MLILVFCQYVYIKENTIILSIYRNEILDLHQFQCTEGK